MTFDHDPELPAGYQDADLEMAELEAAGARSAALRARGICDHGWRQGARGANDPATAHDLEGKRVDAVIPDGHDLCLHCGRTVPSW